MDTILHSLIGKRSLSGYSRPRCDTQALSPGAGGSEKTDNETESYRTRNQVPRSSVDKGVTHTTWGGEDKLKKKGTVEGKQKTGRKARGENPRHRKQGVQRPRGIRGHV